MVVCLCVDPRWDGVFILGGTDISFGSHRSG